MNAATGEGFTREAVRRMANDSAERAKQFEREEATNLNIARLRIEETGLLARVREAVEERASVGCSTLRLDELSGLAWHKVGRLDPYDAKAIEEWFDAVGFKCRRTEIQGFETTDDYKQVPTGVEYAVLEIAW